jgi:iron(III) transport system substrate-binding protein
MNDHYSYTLAIITGLLVGFANLLPVDSSLAGEAKPAWQLEWEKTLEAAKKEGELFIFSSDTAETLLTTEFQKKYPEIKVKTGTPGGGAAVNRILAERRAGKYIADLYITGATSIFPLYESKGLDPIRSILILPEVLDQSQWWEGKHHYPDPEGKYIFSFEGVMRVDITYNTNLVNPADVKSFWDVLDPKWKGKILVFDPMEGRAGTGLRFLFYHPELGPDYVKRLFSEMGVTASRDPRQILDWLANGKAAFVMFPAPAVIEAHKAKAQGLAVDWFNPKHFKEGAALTSSGSNVALLNKAPHPNAAKVAINWLLSREGQIAFQKIPDPGHDSLRIDIPKDDVPPYFRRVDGIKYLNIDRPEWGDLKPVRDFIRKVWVQSGK